jgi:hypothetical protein
MADYAYTFFLLWYSIKIRSSKCNHIQSFHQSWSFLCVCFFQYFLLIIISAFYFSTHHFTIFMFFLISTASTTHLLQKMCVVVRPQKKQVIIFLFFFHFPLFFSHCTVWSAFFTPLPLLVTK